MSLLHGNYFSEAKMLNASVRRAITGDADFVANAEKRTDAKPCALLWLSVANTGPTKIALTPTA